MRNIASIDVSPKYEGFSQFSLKDGNLQQFTYSPNAFFAYFFSLVRHLEILNATKN